MIALRKNEKQLMKVLKGSILSQLNQILDGYLAKEKSNQCISVTRFGAIAPPAGRLFSSRFEMTPSWPSGPPGSSSQQLAAGVAGSQGSQGSRRRSHLDHGAAGVVAGAERVTRLLVVVAGLGRGRRRAVAVTVLGHGQSGQSCKQGGGETADQPGTAQSCIQGGGEVAGPIIGSAWDSTELYTGRRGDSGSAWDSTELYTGRRGGTT